MVLTPMRRPLESNSGPPLLPGLMAASVWMTSRILRCATPWISLLTLLTTPAACTHTCQPQALPVPSTCASTYERPGQIQYRMISVTCPEALMGLSAMVLYIMRSRDYPTSA